MRVATIANLEDRTSEDERTGAMRSVQAADLSLPEEALRELWSPMHLERLARTYWRFLARVTLGLVRVRYTQTTRSLVLLAPALKLITFAAPEYELDPAHGVVRWRITSGLLVARRGRDGSGYLQIEVHRLPRRERRTDTGGSEDRAGVGTPPPGTARAPSTDEAVAPPDGATASPGEGYARACLHIEIEVAGFYPAIASRLGRRIYGATQSRIHVIVTHGFLRSLARLNLAESRVGRFAEP